MILLKYTTTNFALYKKYQITNLGKYPKKTTEVGLCLPGYPNQRFVPCLPFAEKDGGRRAEDRGRRSDFQLPTSDFRFPTSDFPRLRPGTRFPISDFQLPTSDFRLPISDFRLPTSDLQLPTSDSPTSDFRHPISIPNTPN
jgi:hypothetical protein